MEFKIGDKVRVRDTGVVAEVSDVMLSQKLNAPIFEVSGEYGPICNFYEDELEPVNDTVQYRFQVNIDVADNVVIAVMDESVNVEADLWNEVARGHGHIIHPGSAGVAQAFSYAAKMVLKDLYTGIYYKQNNKKEDRNG